MTADRRCLILGRSDTPGTEQRAALIYKQMYALADRWKKKRAAYIALVLDVCAVQIKSQYFWYQINQETLDLYSD